MTKMMTTTSVSNFLVSRFELTLSPQNLAKRNFKVLAFVEDGKTRINITGDGYDNTPATLSTSCLWSLNWPVSMCVLLLLRASVLTNTSTTVSTIPNVKT